MLLFFPILAITLFPCLVGSFFFSYRNLYDVCDTKCDSVPRTPSHHFLHFPTRDCPRQRPACLKPLLQSPCPSDVSLRSQPSELRLRSVPPIRGPQFLCLGNFFPLLPIPLGGSFVFQKLAGCAALRARSAGCQRGREGKGREGRKGRESGRGSDE